MRFLLVLVMLVSTLFAVTAQSVLAWHCPPGVPDTGANERSGVCFLPTPPPVVPPVPPASRPTPPLPPSTPTLVVPVDTVVPTAVPTTSTPAPVVETATPGVAASPTATASPPQPQAGQQAPTQPPAPPSAPWFGSDHRVAVCHYEPSTGNAETRLVQPDQVQADLDLGDTLAPVVNGHYAPCEQPQPVVMATSTPVPASTPPPPAQQPLPATATPTMTLAPTLLPLPTDTPVPAATDMPAATPVPTDTPAATDVPTPQVEFTCEPQVGVEWQNWYADTGRYICPPLPSK